LGLDKDGPEVLQRQAGAEVELMATAGENAGDALDVTLLADGLTQGGLEVTRVDDGVVDRPLRQLVGSPERHGQLARPVGPLAADGRLSAEDRPLVAVYRALHRAGEVGVTGEALEDDLPRAAVEEPGGQVPALLLAVPADGRLVEEPVALGEVGV